MHFYLDSLDIIFQRTKTLRKIIIHLSQENIILLKIFITMNNAVIYFSVTYFYTYFLSFEHTKSFIGMFQNNENVKFRPLNIILFHTFIRFEIYSFTLTFWIVMLCRNTNKSYANFIFSFAVYMKYGMLSDFVTKI